MLSIVIPALNEEKYLPRLLSSIKSQDFSDYEIIVSDANSEDRTREVAAEHGCTVVVDARRHPSYQRNTGAKNAQGDVILFLDADTVLPDNFLANVYNEFNKRGLSAAGFYLKFDSKKLFYKIIYGLVYNGSSAIAQYFKPIAVGAGIMARKEFHEKINGFDETILIGEDHDYCDRILKIGKFRLIKSARIIFSVRRMEEEGKIKHLIKWFYGSLYVIFRGPIRKQIMSWEFGKHQ